LELRNILGQYENVPNRSLNTLLGGEGKSLFQSNKPPSEI